MKTDEKTGSDRAESTANPLRLELSSPLREHDQDFEIEATAEGLLCNNYMVIPWDWIESAKRTLIRQ